MPHLTSIEEMALERGMEAGIQKGIEEGIQKGIEAGIQKGLEEGRKEGRLGIIRRLLERRWGKLGPALEQRLKRLSSDDLELLAEALLDFQSPAQLQTWLSARPGH